MAVTQRSTWHENKKQNRQFSPFHTSITENENKTNQVTLETKLGDKSSHIQKHICQQREKIQSFNKNRQNWSKEGKIVRIWNIIHRGKNRSEDWGITKTIIKRGKRNNKSMKKRGLPHKPRSRRIEGGERLRLSGFELRFTQRERGERGRRRQWADIYRGGERAE